MEIFNGMTEKEQREIMKFIHAGENFYSRGQIIFSAGDLTENAGLVLSGSVLIENNDIWGNSALLGIMKAGEIFAASYALTGAPLLVDVRANEDCKILFLRVKNIPERFSKLTKNLLAITARKNLLLSERSFINSHKSIRRKVMSFLHSISLKEKSRDIKIPFNRQQMADYLNVDRSALSKELCSMRRDGIIEFRKNHFIIISHNTKRGD